MQEKVVVIGTIIRVFSQHELTASYFNNLNVEPFIWAFVDVF